jgi:NADPH-dependent 2,4-dienoyl-CoA reductase/sulfur reductase-like enzyme/nitrite reductase/ring-hydroxylating ferredoxin subunit
MDVSQHNAVCKLSEIEDGEMKEVKVGETPVLLARVEGKCYALAAHCTHYGAPLAEGYLSGGRIVCPWHHACFNARTGDLEEPPALDSLAAYPVRIEGDDVIVDLLENAADRRTPEMTAPDIAADGRTFVIIGGGAAGYAAAQTLREDGFAGRIVLITPETHLPYDRPNLSKDYLQGSAEPEWMPLRPDDFYTENGIEMFREKVKRLARGSKQIEFENGGSLNFDLLLIATGGVPRTLDLPGSDLKNVFVLRSFSSADAIIAATEKAENIAVIGASFIGMEAAFSLTKRGKHVTVIAPDRVPFEKTLGPEIGKLFQNVHEKNGVTFRLASSVTGFDGKDRVEKVFLKSGEPVVADVVIVGVGVRPATDFLDGFELRKDGGVVADANLQIGDGIYAAGDIVHFPDARTRESTRIEHWRTALQLGRCAAHNMAGKATPFDGVPFFWTTQFDVTLNYVGHATGWDRTIVQGNIESQDFLVFYVKDDSVQAVAGMNRDYELDVWEERFRHGEVPTPSELENELAAKAAT